MSNENYQYLNRLNSLYNSVFEHNIDMSRLEDRIKLQKFVYILKFEGLNLGYDFSWYIRGPYSPELTRDGYFVSSHIDSFRSNGQRPEDELVIRKLRHAGDIIQDVDNAELLASYLYLKDEYKEKAINELQIRKPRYSVDRIHKIVNQWNKLRKSV